MSTLNVSNITDGTTSVGTSYVVNGSAKAWVNFNGTGTIAARDSLNLSSLTDNGTGNYVVNFSNSMANGNYAPAHGNPDTGAIFYNAQADGQSTSSTRIRSFVTSTVAAIDASGVAVTISGDLA